MISIRRSHGTILIVAAVLAFAGWRYLSLPPEIFVVHPERREVIELVIGSGRVRAVRQSEIGSEVAGTVEKVTVEEGDRARSGQPLILLRRRDVERQLEQARLALETARGELERIRRGPLASELDRERAELERRRSARELAALDLERATKLFDKNVLARADLDRFRSSLDQAKAAEQSQFHSVQVLLGQPRPEDLRVAEARVREAEATLRLWEEQLGKRTIVSPADGLILKRKVEPGQSVVPGNALLLLSLTDRTEVYVETDENNLRKLRVGQKATVVAPSYQDAPFGATLDQIGPEVDNQRGVVGLRLRPDSLPDYARPDMTVDVNIEVARFPDALSVPATALLEQNGKAFVFEVKQERAEIRPVKVLGKGADRVAIDGIGAEVLVVARAAEARPGKRVRPREVRN